MMDAAFHAMSAFRARGLSLLSLEEATTAPKGTGQWRGKKGVWSKLQVEIVCPLLISGTNANGSTGTGSTQGREQETGDTCTQGETEDTAHTVTEVFVRWCEDPPPAGAECNTT